MADPIDVSDEEWAFLAPYLMLIREDAPRRDYELREMSNVLHYWKQMQRWIERGVK